MAALNVIRPGMLTTVQDAGRWGYQHLGVPVAGPMDWYSHALANRLLGNAPGAATLEITLLGPELEATADLAGVVCGAEFDVSVGEMTVRPGEPFTVRAGDRLRFSGRRAGARAFLAVRGGFAVPQVLGSRATSLSSRMGPYEGRPLRAGDILPIGAEPSGRPAPGRPLPLPSGGARVRVMDGPHEERFTAAALDVFSSARFTITPDSNRMGYRCAGPSLAHRSSADILSDATPIGSVQVPASGQPILLMADRQTTGGYPKIATVITADLPLAGQLAPGDWIEFERCSPEVADRALHERLRALDGEGE